MDRSMLWWGLLVFGTCAVRRASAVKLAFVTTADEHGLAPGIVALLRCRAFYPEAALYVAMDSAHATSSSLQEHLGHYKSVVEPLFVDVASSPLLAAVQRLRYGDASRRSFYNTPWPLECYFQMVVPELVLDKGVDYVAAIDYDVFANDDRLLGELGSIEGIGLIRLYPKECWRAFTSKELNHSAYAQEAAAGYPAFHDPARRRAGSWNAGYPAAASCA